jgi:hypothetical protein
MIKACWAFCIISFFKKAMFQKLALLPSSGKSMNLVLLGPLHGADLCPWISDSPELWKAVAWSVMNYGINIKGENMDGEMENSSFHTLQKGSYSSVLALQKGITLSLHNS